MTRPHGNALEVEEDLQPFGSPSSLTRAGDACERAEIQAVDSFGGDVVVVPACRTHERHRRATLIEGEDLRPGISEPLRLDEAEQGALAGSGRSDDERVADIAHVEVQAEGRRPTGGRPKERRALGREGRAGVGRQTGPDTGDR